jgi:hypothetical protein
MTRRPMTRPRATWLGPSRSGLEGEPAVLEEWMDAVCLELGLDRDEIDRDLVLNLARDVAHGVARPAAPLTAYLLGLAAGQGADPRQIAARITAMAEAGFAPKRKPGDLPG